MTELYTLLFNGIHGWGYDDVRRYCYIKTQHSIKTQHIIEEKLYDGVLGRLIPHVVQFNTNSK